MTLSFILNNFSHVDQNLCQQFTNFLNFPNVTKILLCDLFNYLLFINVNEKEYLKLNIIAYNSILIKFKYVTISPNKDLKEYKKKIFENLKQFGAIEKNEYFKNYMKNILIDSQEFNESNKKIELPTEKINKPKIEQQNILEKKSVLKNTEAPSEKNIFEKEENVPTQKNASKGIGSYLISALGFGPESEKVNNIKKRDEINQDQKKSEVDKQNESNTGPEMYYDSQKKRWVLRGKIYEDESPGQSPNSQKNENDETNIKTGLEKPSQLGTQILPPPKSKISSTPVPVIQKPALKAPEKPTEKQETTNLTNPPPKITNPFDKSLPSNKPQVKAPKANLTNRYTSYADYNK
jgi:hypothetical protein